MVTDKCMHIFIIIMIEFGFHAIITFTSRLLAENKKQLEEYLMLLNWIKIGITLKQSDDDPDKEDSKEEDESNKKKKKRKNKKKKKRDLV